MAKVFIDLFCGLGGASSAFCEENEWKVIRIDNNPELLDHVRGMWVLDMNRPGDVLATITAHLYDIEVDELFVWASPPCTEFSTKNPNRDEFTFDLALLENTIVVIELLDRDWETIHPLQCHTNER